MASVIRVNGLVKRFGDLTAVNGVSFEVQSGEIFGLLGPNGAGKTTTLEILEGLQLATGGNVQVLGFDPKTQLETLKQRIGVQLQTSSYYDYLQIGELLKLLGSFYDRTKSVDELLALVGLTEKKKSRITELSGGQLQRFSIIASLVNDPDLVFLDEPTTGLDPQSRHNLWEVIRTIHRSGKTVMLTTHYMEEAQTLCDRVAIIDSGKIVALDTPRALINDLHADSRLLLRTSALLDLDKFQHLPGVKTVAAASQDGREYRFNVEQAQKTLPAILQHVDRLGLTVENVEIQPPNLEDVFLALTGKKLRV